MLFHHRDFKASHLRSFSDAVTDPCVISSAFIKDIKPIRIVETSHAGLNDLGWKSEMVRQSLVDG